MMPMKAFLPAAALLCAGALSPVLAQTRIKAADVVINGESFFAAATITSELTRLARADGYIGAGESFRQIAVSGAVMSGILSQYKNCTPKPVYVIGDGGGNDLMGSCGAAPTPDCAAIKNALGLVKQYFDEMKADGTKRVIWMRYPDPYGSNWATLKANQDVYNPEVEKICKASVEPKCYWIDMRTAWEGHYAQYTSDGIHPTAAGSTATAEAFWTFAKDNGFFDLAATGARNAIAEGPGAFRVQGVSGGGLVLSSFLEHPAAVAVRMTSLSGRTVLDATAEGRGPGTLRFPLGSLAPGVYRLDVQAGAARLRTAVVAP
jgi:lysophospholipase L1-like esterase